MKKCNKCGEEKQVNLFYRDASKQDGLTTLCKDCKKEAKNGYASKNRKMLAKKSREYRIANLSACRERERKYSIENREKRNKKVNKFFLENPEKKKIYIKRYKEKPGVKSRIQERQRTYESKKRSECPIYRLRQICRSRLHMALKSKGLKKKTRTFDTIGCSPEDLKKHIENQFTDGMSWDNHGEWHIDHIKPLSSGETEEDILKLSHYSNLQPLWAEENFSKGCKIVNCTD